MFEFFEGLIEKIGVKLISDFSDKLFDFIKDIKDNSDGENNDNGKRSTQIGSSGDYAKIGSSGDYAQIGSSGYSAQIGSSGDYAKIDISGTNSVGFACGYNSIIKAKKGTWIALCEWSKNEDGKWIPIYAESSQIGNKDYKDFKGRMLKENEYYCLSNKKFYPVDISDGITIKKISEKKRDGITIIKGQTFDNKDVYLVKQDDLSAHGETLREAMEDLTFKKLENTDVEEIVAEIKKTNKVTRIQYRAITGACSFGTNQFCKQHNIEDLEEIELEELRKILINDYGADKFWSLIDKD